jgi:hypothetical protein
MYSPKGENLPASQEGGSVAEKYPSSADELKAELLSLMTIIKSRDKSGGGADSSKFIDQRLDQLLEETLNLFDSNNLYARASIVHNWKEGLQMFRTLAEGAEEYKAEKRGARDS